MHLGARPVDYVHHLDTLHAQHIRDQRSVAAPPYCLSAHHGRSKSASDVEQFVQALFELQAGHVIGITAKLEVAPRGVRGIRPRPAASAECNNPLIGDAILGKRTAQRPLCVLRLSSRTWKAPHIRDSLNPIVFE